MPFWQQIALILVATAALGGLLLLRARLALVVAAASPAPTSPPTKTENAVTPGSLAEAIADVAVIRAEWRAHQKHLDAYLEAFNDLEDTIEHKRRRTTAAASKLEREQPTEPAPVGNAALLARARGMGLPV